MEVSALRRHCEAAQIEMWRNVRWRSPYYGRRSRCKASGDDVRPCL